MEGPNPPAIVEPFLPATSSRPGPTCGCGERVFQNPNTGKYDSVMYSTIPDPSSASSSFPSPFAVTQQSSLTSRTLGRTGVGIMEGPNPPAVVEPFLPATSSRPGPTCGCGERVFQNPKTGKYDSVIYSPIPDPSTDSSHSPIPPAVSQRSSTNHTPTIEPRRVDLNTRKLRIYYQNVRGLRTKIDSFFLAVADSEYDVIVLTETWLDGSILSTQLFGSSFTVFRTDRSRLNSRKSRGGGVLIAVSSKFCCCIDPAPISVALEQLWIKIKLQQSSVSIGVLYLPPDRRDDMDLIQQHADSIGSVLSRLKPHDIALQFGDYNHPELHWVTSEDGSLAIDSSRSRLTSVGSALYDAFCFHGLTQMNAIENVNSRTLDLILMNESALPNCCVMEAEESLVALDPAHPALDVAVSEIVPISFESAQETRRFDFRRVDYDVLNDALSSIDWQFLDSQRDLDDIVGMFNAEIQQVIETHVPLQRTPMKPAWANNYLRKLKRRRRAALRNYHQHRSLASKRRFVLASNKYKRYNRFLYARYIDRTQRTLRRNPRKFWSFVRSKRKEDGLPTSMFFGGASANTASSKCELFAEHFKSAFSTRVATPPQIDAAILDTPSDSFDFGIFQITEEHVQNAIRKLKHSVCPGPDGIPPTMLKNCSVGLVGPLVKLFNLSLQHGMFPASWKISTLTPIFKKGDKCNIANYRGITSLSACSKVLEIVVNTALFASCRNIISSDQHGFFPNRSVATNLTQFTSLCIGSMDAGLQVDAVYTDFKAAFDRVNHDILLRKLQKMGVSAAFVRWIESYLTGRSVCVGIGASRSEPFTTPSGVPQGSNLGPLLFSLFINDVADILPRGVRLFFADDVKIYMIISCLEDCLELQNLLDSFDNWSERNFLTLCVEKCNIITFCRKLQPIKFNYSLSGQILERVDQVKDLGVLLDRELTFRIHYEDIISRANKQLGFIFKIADGFRDPLCMKALYCALVRSMLESAVVVWCPYSNTWIDRIEAIQRKFVRRALRHLPWRDAVNLPPYEHRCMLLGIETLERRRINAQIAFVAKVLTNEIDSPAILSKLNIYAPERHLRRRNFLHLESRNSRYGQHDPIRFMSARFNEVAGQFDFNEPARIFLHRLRNRIRRV